MKKKYDLYNDLICKTYVEMVNAENRHTITASEICRKAKISRTTYYNHYSSVDEIMDDVVAIINRPFIKFIEECKENYKKMQITHSIKEYYQVIDTEFMPLYFKKIKENKEFMKCIYEKNYLFALEETNRLIYKYFWEPYLKYLEVSENDKRKICNFYKSGIESLIYDWIKNDCEESEEEIIENIRKCMDVKIAIGNMFDC